MADQTRSNPKPFLRTLDGEAGVPPPIWLMRQAGRYLPEYREIRAKAPSFLEFCYAPTLAAEATLQPIRRFGFDAAILFSDILVIPDALGQKVSFESGEGPRLEPIVSAEDFAKLAESLNLARLAPVFETIERVAASLPSETAFIGFCGAPWTVASYMIAGKGTPDQAPARLFAYRHPDLFQRLIDRLTAASIDYLSAQISAGVEAVQIFDSWAGVLPAGEFEQWCVAPIKAIVSGLKQKHKTARIIGFPRGAGPRLRQFAQDTAVSALGLDSSIDPVWAAAEFDQNLVLQGNLDPLALVAGGEALDRSARRILSALRGRPHIFNLGHGVVPETPLDHVSRLVALLREGAPG
ncbi:uroporphyrinogen decarboxylase [Methylocapsa acidiphila]|uniref:uroporphyrinogen decarboxylase n=1 Tax=Methylocapsa acidiphila TaxID=133552 RepID=UPI000418B613|nr:uroporphyrinogen decarboxylase [Methylocapsa acidiphila]